MSSILHTQIKRRPEPKSLRATLEHVNTRAEEPLLHRVGHLLILAVKGKMSSVASNVLNESLLLADTVELNLEESTGVLLPV